MSKLLTAAVSLIALLSMTGCSYLGGRTDLAQVAQESGLKNITTGDGTYENYTTTGHYTGTEIGIGVGIPFVTTLFEIFPGRTSAQLLRNVAQKAKDDQADGMINMRPESSLFTGIPFVLVGVYIDRTEGTGIKGK